jgi:hypothetical protein
MPLRSPERLGEIAPLGDDTVERRADALEPTLGVGELRRRRREAHQRRGAAVFFVEAFQLAATFRQRHSGQCAAIGIDQKVEHDEQRRRFRRQALHAAHRRMNPLQQRIERERTAGRDRELAVEHEFPRLERPQRRHEIGKIPRHQPARFRLDLDLCAVAERQRAKAVPLRLVLPLLADRNRIDGERLHRQERQRERQGHVETRRRRDKSDRGAEDEDGAPGDQSKAEDVVPLNPSATARRTVVAIPG